MSDTVRSDERLGESHDVSIMQGVSPGRKINDVSVLDLRNVDPEEIARIEEIHDVSVLLISRENSGKLRGARINDVSTMIVSEPEERVMITPHLELSRSGMESMPDGQQVLLIGNLFIKPDVPPALALEKFASIRIIGIFVACEGVHGALLGKSQNVNGLTLALADDVTNIVRGIGQTKISPEYLFNLPDDCTFVNIGETHLDPANSPDLLRQKIRSYYNAGMTRGPDALIAVVQARCAANVGAFETTR